MLTEFAATSGVAGGASEGALRKSQRYLTDERVGLVVPSDLIVTMHFGEAANAECSQVVDERVGRFMHEAVWHIAMLRQQGIVEKLATMDFWVGASITSCTHGLEEAGAPAQRTLTSARAAIGTTA